MAWIYLIVAGMCEMVWPLGFKYTNGFKQHYWAVGVTFGVMTVSLWLLSRAINLGMHVGSAYAVWTGLGAFGTAILGIILFKEPADAIRLTCLAMIVGGAVGLKLFSPEKSMAAGTTSAAEARR